MWDIQKTQLANHVIVRLIFDPDDTVPYDVSGNFSSSLAGVLAEAIFCVQNNI